MTCMSFDYAVEGACSVMRGCAQNFEFGGYFQFSITHICLFYSLLLLGGGCVLSTVDVVSKPTIHHQPMCMAHPWSCTAKAPPCNACGG